jgi:hypothetical protein
MGRGGRNMVKRAKLEHDSSWAQWELEKENERRARHHLTPVTAHEYAEELKRVKGPKALRMALMEIR